MAAPAANQHQCRWLGKLRRIHRTAPVLIFLPIRPPVGPDGMAPNHSDFARRKFLPGSRGNPRKWGPGKGEYERGALILSRPRRRFGSFAAVGKGTRRPQAAKSPREERNRSIIVPSSAPVCALGHLPPRGKAYGRPHGPAPTANLEAVLSFVGDGHWPARRILELFQAWVGEALGPPAVIRTGSVCSVNPGAGMKPQQRRFLQAQGPVARREFRPPLRFCAPEILLNLTGTRPP